MSSNNLPKKGIVDSLTYLNGEFQKIKRQLCCSSGTFTGIVYNNAGSTGATFSGAGTTASPLTINVTGAGTSTNIYNSDGTIPTGVARVLSLGGAESYLTLQDPTGNTLIELGTDYAALYSNNYTNSVEVHPNLVDIHASAGSQMTFNLPTGPYFYTTDNSLNNGDQAGTYLTTDVDNKMILKAISVSNLQSVTTVGNTTSNELLITGNTLSNTNKGLHISFDATANKSTIRNIDVNANTNTTNITIDLHNIEFLLQGGFRVLGLNDQQSGSLAAANFNGRVKIEDAFNDNEAVTLGRLKTFTGNTAQTTKGIYSLVGDSTTTVFNIAHGLSSTPTWYMISQLDTISGFAYSVTVDSTNIIITCTSAPTSTYRLAWRAEL